ncbi:MAG: glucosaminidase domain-containing protein [Treponema sp.]|nr:glucosaminidase domain-containing protein [Treponema sp.]
MNKNFSTDFQPILKSQDNIERFEKLESFKIEKRISNFLIFLITAIFFAFLLFEFSSCVSTRAEKNCSRELLGNGIKNENQLAAFFLSHNPNFDKKKITEMAAIYISESEMENINSDAAFVQMCLETGFLKFGNLVTPEMNNFCGLGAIGPENPGEVFPDVKTGIRAHIQHLQAYATPADVSLNNPLVDPRYSWPHKAKNAKTVFDLAGNWAADKEYGAKLDNLLSELEKF